jgi:hypothetical protein
LVDWTHFLIVLTETKPADPEAGRALIDHCRKNEATAIAAIVARWPGTLFAMGTDGQNLFVDQANRLVIAKLSSQSSPVDLPAWTLTHQALAELRRCLLGQNARL